MIQPNNISYKDTAARVVKKESGYYRYIFHEYKAEYEHLMQSGLYGELTQKELLIKHQEIQVDIEDPLVYKLLFPSQILFQSYPFEWSYVQWTKAIIAYLSINLIALKYGMILKDATPYNFYMYGGKAVMFDTSSFMFFKNKDKWIAYNQFCTEFLGPLALMHYNGQKWARLTKTHLRGLPLKFISKQLPLKSWFHFNTFLHIHLHSMYTIKKGNKRLTNNTGFTKEKISSLFGMILSSIKSWTKHYQYTKNWFGYYENDIESSKYLKNKVQIVTNWLEKLAPNTVVDLGANTGKFSFIAGKFAKKVIALEADDTCVDIIENEIYNQDRKNIATTVMDLVDSTSNMGVLNKEIKSIFIRAQSDMVLALALVHHLRITDGLTFHQISGLLYEYSRKYVIVEYVPKLDIKVQLLLQDKTKNFTDYNEDDFIDALFEGFKILQVEILQESERKLFLLEKIK